jgi:hypothetical protein
MVNKRRGAIGSNPNEKGVLLTTKLFKREIPGSGLEPLSPISEVLLFVSSALLWAQRKSAHEAKTVMEANMDGD